MKKLLFVCFIFIVLVTFRSNSIAQPKDVEGWRDARWGMTENQILEKFKGEAVKLKVKKNIISKYSTIGINEITIDSNKYTVYFLFDTSNTLQQVNINLVSSASRKTIETIFNSLISSFIKTYGKPIAEKDRTREKFRNIGALWIFPTTDILADAMIGNTDQIIILFTKHKGKTPKQYGY
jgi:hypothetical protein